MTAILRIHLQQYFAQAHAHLPPAAVAGHQPVVVLGHEAQLRHHLVNLLVQQLDVQIYGARVQAVQLIQQHLHPLQIVSGVFKLFADLLLPLHNLETESRVLRIL